MLCLFMLVAVGGRKYLRIRDSYVRTFFRNEEIFILLDELDKLRRMTDPSMNSIH